MIEFRSLVEALAADNNIEKSLGELTGETDAVGFATILDSDCMSFLPSLRTTWPTSDEVAGVPSLGDAQQFYWADDRSSWPDLRQRVVQASRLVGWNDLPVGWRWQIAEQSDAQNRPMTVAEDNEAERHLYAGYHGRPVESVRRPAMWSVPMCCAWIATRDIELVEHIWLNGDDSADWLNRPTSLINTYDAETLAERSRLLERAGHEALPSAGASLAFLEGRATRGSLHVLGQCRNEGAAERIPDDAWANLRIDPSDIGYQAQPLRQQYSSPWWSGLRVLEEEVRQEWPEVPEPLQVVEAEGQHAAEDPAGATASMYRWLVGEIERRRGIIGEKYNRDTMVVVLRTEFPGTRKKDAERFYQSIPEKIRFAPMGRPPGSNKHRKSGRK